MLIVSHAEVREILRERVPEIVDLVASTYRSHALGKSVLPHSSFLRFPGGSHDRIIALPAYLDGAVRSAGLKWIASFPGNTDVGLDRASAVIILNSPETGRPEALIEGSLISAARTAASATLAAALFTGSQDDGNGPTEVGLIGCGTINLEILRCLAATLPTLRAATAFDINVERMHRFRRNCAESVPAVALTITSDRKQALADHGLVSIATTAAEPYIDTLPHRPGAVVLHVSLRDLTTSAVLAGHNVVDDADHVCREGTSLHLTEQLTGGRDFIDTTIGAVLCDPASFRRDPGKTVIFSPFGLGILDVALARFVRTEALRCGTGLEIDGFLPPAKVPG